MTRKWNYRRGEIPCSVEGCDKVVGYGQGSRLGLCEEHAKEHKKAYNREYSRLKNGTKPVKQPEKKQDTTLGRGYIMKARTPERIERACQSYINQLYGGL